jgi:hypothetical protein
MAEPPSYTDPMEDARTPHWVKVFGVVALILILLFAALHLTGNSLGGIHG